MVAFLEVGIITLPINSVRKINQNFYFRTALAEAELEYNNEHVSKAVTVRFKIDESSIPSDLALPNNSDLFALIWTTTPWTLPANQAIAFNEYISYVLIRIADSTDTYIIASELVSKFEELIKKPVCKVGDISSKNYN